MAIIIDNLVDGRTFLELQNEALGDSFDSGKYRDLTKVWLNEALRKIARKVKSIEHESTQAITTNANSDTYAAEGDVARVGWIVDVVTRDELEEISLRELDVLPPSRGRPSAFALTGAGFVFWPAPDAIYDFDVRFWATSVELVNDDDTPASFGLPNDYVDLLVTYARARLFRMEDDFEAAREYMGEFLDGLKQARADLARPSSAGRRQIPGMFAVPRRPSFRRPA